MLDLIASFLVRGLNRFFHVMPISFNLWLGRRFGVLIYILSGKRRRVAYANLKAAFCGEKTPEELKRITKAVCRNMAQTFVEILSMTKVDKKYVEKFIVVRDMETIEKASKNPNGIILLTAHFGNWELNAIVGSRKGFPLYFLGREQKMERLNELLNVIRESTGNIVIRKGTDAKKIFRVLRAGKIVGMAGDQNAGANGELLDFFGRPASTAVGPYRIAERTGACILPAFIRRIKGPYHELVLEPVMTIRAGEDIIPYMQEYNRLLEKHIRNYPDQWLWMHKRWKATPVKKVMVLDDEKKGHLKQSLAVVEQIKRYRADEGYAPEHLEVDIVKIRFKNKLTKTIFNASSRLFTPRCQGCLKCLKRALDKESYETVSSRYADVVVSCASTLSGVNKMMKMENNARNVTVLDPGFLNRGKFDLIVLPRHDLDSSSRLQAPGDNVIVTDLAPTSLRPEGLASFEGRSHEAGGSPGKIHIGLLLGGDNPHFTFGKELLDSLVQNMRKACEDMDGYLYMTTSRRTSVSAETTVLNAFKGYTRCAMFVSGREDTDEHTVEKIFASSDVICVSGESISMVSEAVSSGKPVLVFMPDKKSARSTKYERFVDDLEGRKHLRRVKPENLPDEIRRAFEGQTKFSVPDDNEKIYKKLFKLF
ncbi:MAG: ELM1/GtrOC1 family putative glycosyltransferase [Candidatus Omnitrophota bacterium]